MANPQSHISARSFEPTPRLLASALATGPAVETAKAIRPAYIPIHIDFRAVEQDYDEFCKQNQKLLQETLGRPAIILHKYTLLLQSGIFRLDSRTVMVGAVVLHKTDDLNSVIEGESGKKDLVWGEVGMVHFIPGNSSITSVGKGSVVCFIVFYGNVP
ncbi:uncharacterized protein BDZ99DRAFT_167135 [Mytilinidion resinicola]|uniref:Uncharacterized protein n=1 Tax=Mytilinidion resinicola TaxID=574789 RepID=A0A6A6Y4J7_9PEZI|nr:uncharacterized protein BDZ99DRAFT_167135 [Mytilinidion resinicola]KAF2803580.1 hypothetical protein BDZ99DRAFT_167135 [Mytilinidion resinicola]